MGNKRTVTISDDLSVSLTTILEFVGIMLVSAVASGFLISMV